MVPGQLTASWTRRAEAFCINFTLKMPYQSRNSTSEGKLERLLFPVVCWMTLSPTSSSGFIMRWRQLAQTEMDRFSFWFWDASKFLSQWSKQRETRLELLMPIYCCSSVTSVTMGLDCLFMRFYLGMTVSVFDADNSRCTCCPFSLFLFLFILFFFITCVWENKCQNIKLQQLLPPAFWKPLFRGMSLSGVSSIVSGSVRRLFQDSLRRNEGRLTTWCHVGLPPVVIGLDVLRQS